MDNKTPKFEEALNEILENLKPHKRKCQECQTEFEITSEDIEFYKKLRVPPPTLCPNCRLQRRLGNRISFLPIFYKKSCSVSGHTEKIIAYYSEQNPVKVYDNKYYNSDNWEATEFGKDIDADKNFFPQFKSFALVIPHQPLFNDPKSVNSDYTVGGMRSKDCYYVASPMFSEKIYYSYYPKNSRECLDVNEVEKCELCYECIDSSNCYKSISVVESFNCIDSFFLYDCRNCQNCFMSSNIRNGQYYFRNQKLSKEQYWRKMANINLGKRSVYQKYKQEFDELILKAIKKNVNNIKVENVIGDNILQSKNCYNSFSISNSVNIRYNALVNKGVESMDVTGGENISYLYESSGIANSNNTKFSAMCRNSLELEYSMECNNCENCFACFGLKNKRFHIFNKPYSEKEYWQKVDEIKTKMLERGEYGEFFPLKDSPFPYQDSNAQTEFPLAEKEIKEKNWHWQDEIKSDLDLSKMKTLQANEVPDDIKKVKKEIIETPIICEKTGKPFKIMSFELEFYKRINLPIPVIHPLERIKEIFKYKRHYKLYVTTCAKCGKKIQTVFDPNKTRNIYCDECYKREVE